MSYRIASFNVENLFERAAILNLRDQDRSDQLLRQVATLQGLLDAKTYTPAIRDAVRDASRGLSQYIDIRKDAGTFGDWKRPAGGGEAVLEIAKSAKGRSSWLGEITFKTQRFDDIQRKNTGRVVSEVDADLLCAVEVEGMDVIRQFNAQVLRRRYAQYVMIDSPNDPRGIDVACLTKHRITGIRTHVFDSAGGYRRVFSRDCLEVALDIGQDRSLFVLCNHFKSQRGTPAQQEESAAKRRAQSSRVVEILGETYNLERDWVVVLGDLNEDSSNPYASLTPLFEIKGLTPVIDPTASIDERWSYYYSGAKKGQRFSQLDYIFLSKPLADRITAHGHERRGIAEIDQATAQEGLPLVKPFDTVTSWDTSASDHAALWVDIDI